MKLRSILVLPLMYFAVAFACQAQQGPSPTPTVVLSWTQSTSAGVLRNCIYRGTDGPSQYTLPAIFCSATPITTYTDTNVTRGQAYRYAVTSQTGTLGSIAESQYSSEVAVTVPPVPNAPTGTTAVIK